MHVSLARETSPVAVAGWIFYYYFFTFYRHRKTIRDGGEICVFEQQSPLQIIITDSFFFVFFPVHDSGDDDCCVRSGGQCQGDHQVSANSKDQSLFVGHAKVVSVLELCIVVHIHIFFKMGASTNINFCNNIL